MYDIVKELRLAVDKIYPVTSDNIEKNLRIRKIVDLKRDNLIKDGFIKACSQLSQDLSVNFKHHRSHLGSPFPNYSFTVVLETRDHGTIYVEDTMEIRISLISEYFTVYPKRNIFHRDILHHNIDIFPVSQSVISAGSSNDLNKIKRLIEQSFSSKKFVNIGVLLQCLISNCVPFGVEGKATDHEYPVYDFLFDSSTGLGSYVLARNLTNDQLSSQ
jgi:hypothetical protein